MLCNLWLILKGISNFIQHPAPSNVTNAPMNPMLILYYIIIHKQIN